MLTIEEKRHIKDILAEGLKINRNINFPYFLDAIDETKEKVKKLESVLNNVLYNQKIIDNKLTTIINFLRTKG